MRQKIVAGNWKMNGSTAMASELVRDIRDGLAALDNRVDVVIIPPAVFVGAVQEAFGGASQVGLQNISSWESGAYTGETSAEMARDVGCQYVLVGHSERRQYFNETDDIVAQKVGRALEAGLTAIVCVGETLEERESGEAEQVVSAQVQSALNGVTSEQWSNIIVAYEPVWAIGTGKTATAEDAQAMHSRIRKVLSEMGAPADNVSLLYGGSVKADNAAALFEQPDIDGGLVGGASLKANEFLGICRAACV